MECAHAAAEREREGRRRNIRISNVPANIAAGSCLDDIRRSFIRHVTRPSVSALHLACTRAVHVIANREIFITLAGCNADAGCSSVPN
jgi:hypothetical protein